MKKGLSSILAIMFVFFVGSATASAMTDCVFTFADSTMSLQGDCTTDETISVMDGYTLNGNHYTITAHDPSGGHFVGGVVENGGTVAHVTKLTLDTANLSNVCDAGDSRLRGIMFEGASGSITHTNVLNINQGASGCQEGNAIEVRNSPFDGTHPNTQSVEIAHNNLEAWQKTGIVCNGDVACHIHKNFVGESATQNDLAANSIQIGFGGAGTIEQNHVGGNQWLGTTNYAATALLLYLPADGLTIQRNNIGGNSDVGVFLIGDNAILDNNRIFDGGQDGINSGYDIGIWNYGAMNDITNNKIRGFNTATINADGQVVIAGGPPQPNPVCFGTTSDCGLAGEP